MKPAVPVFFYITVIIFFLFSCAGVPRGRTTALHDAADTGDIRIIEELISEDSNVDIRDEEGRTALHHAAIAGDILVTAALLNAGADPDLPDKTGRVPLHYAVLSCNPDLTAMLLGADANPFIADKDEETALDIAISIGCEEVEHTINSSL
ncbi:MAG: ankyrin repeat domain-containing protein [Spirochaetaceae bacterium]|nr:ankyrin repeat domain-containing protein [Spirochaetaceae bacterium]